MLAWPTTDRNPKVRGLMLLVNRETGVRVIALCVRFQKEDSLSAGVEVNFERLNVIDRVLFLST